MKLKQVDSYTQCDTVNDYIPGILSIINYLFVGHCHYLMYKSRRQSQRNKQQWQMFWKINNHRRTSRGGPSVGKSNFFQQLLNFSGSSQQKKMEKNSSIY